MGKLNKHEEALNCFEVVCKKNPSHFDSLFHKGIELAEIGNHEKAIEIFDKILTKHNDNINLIYAKSRSKAAIGEYDESMNLLRKAISSDGKTIREWAKNEKIFDKFHDDEQFRKLVKL